MNEKWKTCEKIFRLNFKKNKYEENVRKIRMKFKKLKNIEKKLKKMSEEFEKNLRHFLEKN